MAQSFFVDKRVFVTGASGFIGRHLCAKLWTLGAVVGAMRLDNGILADDTFVGNLCEYNDVSRAISRFRPDVVFHLAAQPIVDTALHNPFDTLETNIRGTYNLLNVCSHQENIKSFVHFSTDKVYGETQDETGTTELSRLDGVSHPYNASKLCADILAQSYASFSNLPISIIRSGNVYGEGDTHWDRLIPYVCKMLVEGKDPVLRSNGFLYRDYIYVSDVIDALLLVGEGGKGIYNLGSEQAYTVKEIVKILEAIHGTSTLPIYADNSHLELRYQHMNYDKINRELGWMPNIGINAGLKRAYDWYKERQSD